MLSEGFELQVERLGPLPVVNHFLDRLKVVSLLDAAVPTLDRRCRLSYALRLGVLLRSIIVERAPIYRQQESVAPFAPEGFGLSAEDADGLNDDQIGRALDRLFDADRGSLLTELLLVVATEFGVSFSEFHNDSTSVSVTGQYVDATGRRMRGKRAPWITYGYSKDHRPDLKQLLFILTSTADGGIPVHFRNADGNANDAKTHIESWEALNRLTGDPNFLYVADSKLCTAENMDYIQRRGGRFITVMPRSRAEDKEFRAWIQTHEPEWQIAWDRPNPRRAEGPRDVWRVYRFPIPSCESWPVIWVWSSLSTLRQERRRRERIGRAVEELEQLQRRLDGPRPRKRTRAHLDDEIQAILRHRRVWRYIHVKIEEREEHKYRQATPGRPGQQTRFRRVTKRRWSLSWTIDEDRIAYDHKSDGMYPLLTNDRSMAPEEVLAAHKRQPAIEKRFEQFKTVHEIAPVFLKNEGRIEALFFLYFVALLVQALIEREVRLGMQRGSLASLPIYPEDRACRHPTTEQVLRLFHEVGCHRLLDRAGTELATFRPQLTELQSQVLDLLGIRRSAYSAWTGVDAE